VPSKQNDLNAVGDLLNWDQVNYMPEGGASARKN
jgi:Zn-dependent M32 family carboxypeptidase